MMSSFDAAARKLATAPTPFPLEDLPSNNNDLLWNEIRSTYGLSLPELSALKNYEQKQRQAQQVRGSIWYRCDSNFLTLVLSLCCVIVILATLTRDIWPRNERNFYNYWDVTKEFPVSLYNRRPVPSLRSLSNVKQFHDNLVPVDVFGNKPQAAEKAHLVPKAANDAKSWVYPTSAVLGIPWQVEDGKVDRMKATKGAVGSFETREDGKKIVYPGLRNLLCNIIRLSNQAHVFDDNPWVMFFPILTLQQAKEWSGTAYDAIVVWTEDFVPLRVGMPPIEKIQEVVDHREINVATSFISELCRFLAHSVFQEGDERVKQYQKSSEEKANLREFFSRNQHEPSIFVPYQLCSDPNKPLLKVSFAANPTPDDDQHPAPDPMLLGFKSANNWCRLHEKFRMVANAEYQEDDISDEGQANLQAYLEWATSEAQAQRHHEITRNIQAIEFAM